MDWISVEDELPATGGHYIVKAVQDGEKLVEVFVYYFWYHTKKYYWAPDNLEVYFTGTITHWMPMPE